MLSINIFFDPRPVCEEDFILFYGNCLRLAPPSDGSDIAVLRDAAELSIVASISILENVTMNVSLSRRKSNSRK